MQYGIVANYCWLLVEGIYLHNLLVLAVFSERSYFTLYLCIGWGEWAPGHGGVGPRNLLPPWAGSCCPCPGGVSLAAASPAIPGAPILFLVPWVVVKFLYENIQ